MENIKLFNCLIFSIITLYSCKLMRKNEHKKINVLIISGGSSNERQISLKSGQEVYKNLSFDQYSVRRLEISQNNQWILSDEVKYLNNKNSKSEFTILPSDIVKDQIKKVDVVFLALHGAVGEDGKIQSLFEMLNVPYTGSGVLASSLGMDKQRCRSFVSQYGIMSPKTIIIKKNTPCIDIEKLIKKSINYPCVVKPNQSGSSIGITLVKNPRTLSTAIKEARKHDAIVLIEEYIKGREITCAIIGNTNNGELISLPPVEIIPENDFFDFKSKYESTKTQEICPAKISSELTEEVKRISSVIHQMLGCNGLTRCDFILKNNIFYFLEINTAPGLTAQSICPKAALAYGWSLEKLMDKIVTLALENESNKK